MPLLRFDNIGKSFGSRLIFRGVSVAVEPGDHVAVVGPNGSGKSTLLRIAAGLLRPTTGSVEICPSGSACVSGTAISRNVGYLAPYVQFYKALTARENLEFLCSLRPALDGSRTVEVLDRVGLLERADDFVGSFSSGMLQRMRLAAATLHEPEVVLLDEPFANLDLPGAELVWSVLDEVLVQGGAVLVATNRDDVAGRSSRQIRISDYS